MEQVTIVADSDAITLGENVIYLMGFSFILGSLFTVLMLLLLDFLRRHKNAA